MKRILYLATGLLVFNLTSAFGQPQGATFQERMAAIVTKAQQQDETAKSKLTRFDLDFPGGTPAQLVKAIETATGKPLNVIIPDETAGTKLPPVEVSDMDVVTLFKTLSENSLKRSNDNEVLRNYGFKTIDQLPTDNSLWTFYSYTRPNTLTQFNIDFAGGTPAQLVKAIEEAAGKPLNVIIPQEDADIKLPPLKMESVNVAQLFTALEQASAKIVSVNTGFSPFGKRAPSYSNFNTGYGFRTQGQLTDNSIWYFHVERPTQPPEVSSEKICRFYSVEPYLKRGFTIDDITTAIQTGWKMADVNPTPELNYHKETKLLIAYGEPEQLKTIEDVLLALGKSDYKFTAPVIDPATGLPLNATNYKSIGPTVDPATGLPLNKTNSAVEDTSK